MLNNPYAAYKRQSVTTLTPVEIVIKLYDECEKQLNRGIHFIENKDYAKSTTALNKAMEIVKALQSVLDMKIEISNNLDALYDYFYREILDGSMKKDTEKLSAILPMIGELKDAFTQISKMPREEILKQNSGNLRNIG